jgi:hypothetical protein
MHRIPGAVERPMKIRDGAIERIDGDRAKRWDGVRFS